MQHKTIITCKNISNTSLTFMLPNCHPLTFKPSLITYKIKKNKKVPLFLPLCFCLCRSLSFLPLRSANHSVSVFRPTLHVFVAAASPSHRSLRCCCSDTWNTKKQQLKQQQHWARGGPERSEPSSGDQDQHLTPEMRTIIEMIHVLLPLSQF